MSLPGDGSAGDDSALITAEVSLSSWVPTTPHARAKRRIATLTEEIEALKQDKAIKQRGEPSVQVLTKESEEMLKKLKQGADSARGDDTGTLKDLVVSWVNIQCCPTPLIRADDKHHRGFVNDPCGKLLCPAEWCWEDPTVRAGICGRTTSFIVSENSWPAFMYENYEANAENLEHGLMKSKLLVMGFKAIFTSPSSANEVDGNGNGADVIENCRRARRRSDQAKVKMCVASIIGMRKVTPHAIAYIACQIRFALSNITSWHTVDGDFDYQIFWNNIVDFFEDPPGAAAQSRINKLLEWWTRKV
ncbi:hypothetical protein EV702DRAFT_1201571 [Suillus placidus]|uniref:Uncharacterized protein n=1 Tax=Suillus placidus TaxID=48579 RepID=A0A9P7CYT9_9AGAM|nr:hypothetical protein EV702DRAFT_1201571 [Suillus placidus]